MESGIEMEQSGTATGSGTPHVAKHHDRGLVAIGLFKIVEAVFFVSVGLGALHFLHHDLSDAVLQLTMKLRMDPEGRLVSFIFDHIDDITSHRLKQIGVATFFYAALRIAEGVGLVMEKTWAEYLTVGLTVSFLPWELYEIVRKPDWFRVGLLIVNLIVLAYILWWLNRRKRLASA